MEVQVRDIIEKIKSEGIAEAEKSAGEIKTAAEKEAQTIIQRAKKEAQAIIENTKSDAEKYILKGKQAVSQAGRDLVLSLRSQIHKLFDAIVKREIKESIQHDAIKSILARVITTWAENGSTDFTVLLPKEELPKLGEYFFARLKQELLKGIEFRVDPRIEAGFRISEKDGTAFYDFSDEGISAAVSIFLNPQLKECMDNAFISGSGT
jgi:V/A-type H+-transporting ATPase subunit E